MPDVVFTKENLLERNQLKAGWRKLKVTAVQVKPGTSNPETITNHIHLTVTEGPDAGTPIKAFFNEETQMGRLVDFVRCFTGGTVEVGKKYSLDSTIGREVHGYCEYDIKTGFNTIRDFKPAQKGGATSAQV